MKINKIILILPCFIFFEVSVIAQKLNTFFSSSDTLILKTEKIRGYGLFPVGAGQIHFKDTTERYDYTVIFPKNISEIKFSVRYVDIKPFVYDWYKKGESNKEEFLKSVEENKIDTLNLPTIRDNTVAIMSGRNNTERIFIVDENNNKDFRDDSVRLYSKMDWKTTDRLIKCNYNIYNGKEMVVDSSWINIGTLRDNELWFFVSHHLESTFLIDKQMYQIGIVDEQSNFCFDEPILALLSENGINKDTLLKKDLIYKGQYLKLKNNYFRFIDISNDGKFVTLIKEKDFRSKFGIQVGMLAPGFKCKTIDGDTIDSNSLKAKSILIANVSGCSPKSYEKYKQLIENSGDIYVIGVESGLKNNLGGILIDVEDKYNKDFYDKYRRYYSSYDCFVIDPEGRVSDIFEIWDWEKNIRNRLKK